MAGTLAMAVGVLLSGLPAILQQQLQYFGIMLNQIGSIKLLFVLYSLLGIAIIGIYLLLSQKIEVQKDKGEDRNDSNLLTKRIFSFTSIKRYSSKIIWSFCY